MSVLLLLIACDSADSDAERHRKPPPSEQTDPPAEATADELIEAIQTLLCEADQLCEQPISSSARSCALCAGITGPAAYEVDPLAAGACVEALPSAVIAPCDAFDATQLPDPCWDVILTSRDLFTFFNNTRYVSTRRDCGDEGFRDSLCEHRNEPLPGCEVDPDSIAACYESTYACSGGLPDPCWDAMRCPQP